MTTNSGVEVLCIYRVKPGQEQAFLRLVERHWPTLRRSGLATDTPATVQRSRDRAGHTVFIELFSWKNAEAPGLAHQAPEVMAVWEPMGALCDGMEFLDVEPVTVDFAAG